MSRNYIGLVDQHEVEMLQDADDAITKCNLWDWLKEYKTEEGNGFTLGTHPNLNKIIDSMTFGHSGSSFAWVMVQMKDIAKRGWAAFELTRRIENVKTVLENVKTDNLSPLDIAEASRGVPGFEGQADAMKRFYEGKMSYAEMRALCG